MTEMTQERKQSVDNDCVHRQTGKRGSRTPVGGQREERQQGRGEVGGKEEREEEGRAAAGHDEKQECYGGNLWQG